MVLRPRWGVETNVWFEGRTVNAREVSTRISLQFPNLPLVIYRLGFLYSRRGSNLLFPAHCLLFKIKLVAALIVTGESGAETIADNNSKTVNAIYNNPNMSRGISRGE